MAEAIHEEAVATYLTVCGQVFLAPQYNVKWNASVRDGGSCPDFVALDIARREIIVVEVSTATDIGTMISNVRARQIRWYSPVLRQLSEAGHINFTDWPIRFLGFIRGDNLARAKRFFPPGQDVAFAAIEDVSFLWKYWDQRLKDGLPR